MAQDESFTNLAGQQLVLADAMTLERGTVVAGRYEVEAALGRGGAGVVVRAYDRELEEAVAIKVLRPELGQSTRWIDRLAREVKLARQLRHPNVCRVFDFEKADGHVFIVMELAPGGALRRELEDGTMRERTPEARLADARAVAEGLAAIHAAGIAHRDVTPQNILRMADGRVVVSDFGLATEVSSTTTSVHGGTIAYMAPEVVRGQRGTFASDVWALGVVIHEIVFGERPTWSKPVGGALVAPIRERTLSRGERLAFEVCRACTEEDPARRPRTAGEVAAWLAGRRVRPASRGRGRVAAALAVVATAAAVGGAVTLRRRQHRVVEAPAALAATTKVDGAPLLEATNAAPDWTLTSKVLATIDDRVRCMILLPDRRTVRYVWGSPPRAEDMDVVTGKRVPSPVVPLAISQGCPEPTSDGKRVLYQAYASTGQPYAFVSEFSDGHAGTPVVPIADPTMSSEPHWLPGGRAFTFDVDHQRMGVFSLDTHRTSVLPDPTRETYHSAFRYIVGSRIFVAAGVGESFQSAFAVFSWPLLSEETRFKMPGLALDVASPDGKALFASIVYSGPTGQLWRLDLERHSATAVGSVKGQGFRYPLFTDAGLAFASIETTSDVWRRSPSGQLERVTQSGDYTSASRCGDDVIAVRRTGSGWQLVRVDRSGGVLRVLKDGVVSGAPACSSDGRTWFIDRWTPPAGIERCDDQGCRMLTSGAVGALAISPDDTRMAFVKFRKTELVLAWAPAGGGEVHELSPTDTACNVGWTSNHTLWATRREEGKVVWAEIDVDTGQDTGKRVPASKDCTDGTPDPASPISPDLRVVTEKRTQIRVIDAAGLR